MSVWTKSRAIALFHNQYLALHLSRILAEPAAAGATSSVEATAVAMRGLGPSMSHPSGGREACAAPSHRQPLSCIAAHDENKSGMLAPPRQWKGPQQPCTVESNEENAASLRTVAFVLRCFLGEGRAEAQEFQPEGLRASEHTIRGRPWSTGKRSDGKSFNCAQQCQLSPKATTQCWQISACHKGLYACTATLVGGFPHMLPAAQARHQESK